MCDNGVKPRTLHRSPGIYFVAKPKLEENFKITLLNCVCGMHCVKLVMETDLWRESDAEFWVS